MDGVDAGRVESTSFVMGSGVRVTYTVLVLLLKI